MIFDSKCFAFSNNGNTGLDFFISEALIGNLDPKLTALD